MKTFIKKILRNALLIKGAGWDAEQMLKAGVPIFYRNEKYPETLKGDLFVKEYPNGAKFLVRKELTNDCRLLEEIMAQMVPGKPH